MKKSLFHECLRLARAKIEQHPQKKFYIHYSFLVQNNKILSCGTNMAAIPPIHLGYHARLDGGCPKTHSEIVAWRRGKGLVNSKYKWNLINIRLNKNGNLMLSKPCKCCQNVMTALGCEAFYYSFNQGFLRWVV